MRVGKEDERERKKKKNEKNFCCCFCHVCERSEDASAEKTDGGERFFVGFDREVRRYLFQTRYSSEIGCDGCEILVRVNTETRKLVKRSSRKGDLKKKFNVKRCRRYRL